MTQRKQQVGLSLVADKCLFIKHTSRQEESPGNTEQRIG